MRAVRLAYFHPLSFVDASRHRRRLGGRSRHDSLHRLRDSGLADPWLAHLYPVRIFDRLARQRSLADLFRRAAGSANELTVALRISRARGYITVADFDSVEAYLDRVRAMLWNLTHPR